MDESTLPLTSHAGIARALMLHAIRARAATGDLIALGDISEALEDLDQVVAEGDYFALIRRAFWLLERTSERSDA